MKLFVWNNPYPVAYGSSLIFAVADTVEAARELALSKSAQWYSCGEFPDGHPNYGEDNKPNFSRESNVELGDPMRIVELPCAEWHRWKE